jgi:hypothetical protein
MGKGVSAFLSILAVALLGATIEALDREAISPPTSKGEIS